MQVDKKTTGNLYDKNLYDSMLTLRKTPSDESKIRKRENRLNRLNALSVQSAGSQEAEEIFKNE